MRDTDKIEREKNETFDINIKENKIQIQNEPIYLPSMVGL